MRDTPLLADRRERLLLSLLSAPGLLAHCLDVSCPCRQACPYKSQLSLCSPPCPECGLPEVSTYLRIPTHGKAACATHPAVRQVLLASHTAWFRAQRCKDRFAACLGVAALKAAPSAAAAAPPSSPEAAAPSEPRPIAHSLTGAPQLLTSGLWCSEECVGWKPHGCRWCPPLHQGRQR